MELMNPFTLGAITGALIGIVLTFLFVILTKEEEKEKER